LNRKRSRFNYVSFVKLEYVPVIQALQKVHSQRQHPLASYESLIAHCIHFLFASNALALALACIGVELIRQAGYPGCFMAKNGLSLRAACGGVIRFRMPLLKGMAQTCQNILKNSCPTSRTYFCNIFCTTVFLVPRCSSFSQKLFKPCTGSRHTPIVIIEWVNILVTPRSNLE